MTLARPQGLRSINIFSPAFNDEATIGRVVNALALLESLTDNFEVVVNDRRVVGLSAF